MSATNPYPFLELGNNVPRLPIPELQETLDLYLEQLKPLLTAEQWEQSKKNAEEFLADPKQGALLHAELKKLDAASSTSWLEGFWDTWYLEDRGPAPINVNPFFIIHPTEDMSQLGRASQLLHSSARFLRVLQEGQIPNDKERSDTLCMTQYGRVFGTCRIPKGDRDLLLTYKDSTHAVVMRNNHIFSIALLSDDGKGVASLASIREQLDHILQCSNSNSATRPSDGTAEGGVGVLTCEPRPSWNAARAELLTSKHNSEVLTTVETALLVLCLDDVTPTSPDEASRLMLHGIDGVNRWFDKLQLIVAADGTAAWNMEHSPYDGHTLLQVATHVYGDMTGAKAVPGAESLVEAKVATPPRHLEWKLSQRVRERITVAKRNMAAFAAGTDTAVVDFTAFGSNWIKKQKMSPDAFLQMAYQLAYYKLRQRVDSTYESCNTKRFYHGRTEVIRVVSAQSKNFCETFASPAPNANKAAALRAAAKRHGEVGKRAKQGKAADRHLFGMWWIARQRRQMYVNEPLPALFADAAYSKFAGSVLSTSNCGGECLDLFGFGPVMSNGLGVGYMLKRESIHVNITSFTSGEAQLYAVHLQQALFDMKVVCDWEAAGGKQPARL